MELEFYQELILTAALSVLFAFLIGKIAGVGHGDGGHHDEARVASCLPNSAESLRRQGDEDVPAVAAAAAALGTGELVRGIEGEIDEVGQSVSGIGIARESVKEARGSTDGLGVGEEKNPEEMPEPVDVDRYRAGVQDEEEREGKEREADSSSSHMKIERDHESEIEGDGGNDSTNIFKDESLLHGEDEWEGIERSELEKRFGRVLKYSSSLPGLAALAELSSDLQLELYGLHKIATEGTCYGSQPLSLKASAWARWHAWKKLGRMTPEVAMEQYISLLSKSIPGWDAENFDVDAKVSKVADVQAKGILNIGHSDLDPTLQNKVSPGVQTKVEDLASDEIESTSGGLKVLQQGLTSAFLLTLLLPTRGTFS